MLIDGVEIAHVVVMGFAKIPPDLTSQVLFDLMIVKCLSRVFPIVEVPAAQVRDMACLSRSHAVRTDHVSTKAILNLVELKDLSPLMGAFSWSQFFG
jgi:hypothetical protein